LPGFSFSSYFPWFSTSFLITSEVVPSFDSRVLVKDLSCGNTFYSLHNFWRRILWFSSNKKMYMIDITTNYTKLKTVSFTNFKAYVFKKLTSYVSIRNFLRYFTQKPYGIFFYRYNDLNVLCSIYSTNVAKNINWLFNNGCRGSFQSPQQAARYSNEIKAEL